MQIRRPGQSGRRGPRPATVLAFAVAPLLLLAFFVPFEPLMRTYLADHSPRKLATADGLRDLRSILLAVPKAYLPAPAESEVPTFHLDVKFKHLKQLRDKRAQARELGVLFSIDEDYVPARLRFDDEETRVKVRLKGDLTDHFKGRRWSLRVKTRDGKAILGMRRFSIQGPHTRGFQQEPLFLDFLKSHGILVPRYFFVNLVINGERIGLMALEEHFAKELLEKQQRREGVILKYDEDPFWRAWLVAGGPAPDFDNWRNADILAFGMGKIGRSPALTEQFRTGEGLIRGVMEDRLAPSQAFDPKLWGRYYAACEIFTAGHMVSWHNLRLYFNPVTAMIEPIGYDANASHHWGETELFDCQEGRKFLVMPRALLADPKIRREFTTSLHDMRREVLTEEFATAWREKEKRYLEILRVDYPWLRDFDWNLVRERVDQLADVSLDTFPDYILPRKTRPADYPPEADLPLVTYAGVHEREGGSILRISNAISKTIEILSLEVVVVEPVSEPAAEAAQAVGPPVKSADRNAGPLEAPAPVETVRRFEPSPLESLPLELAPSHWPERPATAELPFEPPTNLGKATWHVRGTARQKGEARMYTFEARPAVSALSHHPIPEASLEEVLGRHTFLAVDPTGARRLLARAGVFAVAGSLVLPDGYELVLPAGTTLRFEPGSVLVVRGALEIAGSVEAPVVLEGLPANGERGRWQGIVALGREQRHTWSHAVIRDTVGVRLPGWQLTGGVTVVRGDVQMRHVRFEGTTAEDALNLIRSRLDFADVSFADTRSDAFDCDFCEGSIRNGELQRIGGDGIDVSGSKIEVDGVFIRDVQDKAISVGERSEVHARNLRVEDSGTGFASKDDSRGYVEDSTFEGIRHVTLMSYMKKPEYGGALIEARNIDVVGDAPVAIAQLNSRLSLDGADLEPVEIDVEALYREGFMKK